MAIPASSKIAGIPCFSASVSERRGLDTVSLSKIPMCFKADFIPENAAAFGPPPFANWEILLAKGGGTTEIIVANSTMGTMATQDSVRMLVKDSTIDGDVIARENSVLTLANTVVQSRGEEGEKVFGNVFATDNATVTLINSTTQGEVTTQGNGRIVRQ